VIKESSNNHFNSERSNFFENAEVTERVYEEKRRSNPLEYIQTIAILKYKHNIACSPRDHNVTSQKFETTDEDKDDNSPNSPIQRTHRVRTAKYS
jgi:hypothetical protein